MEGTGGAVHRRWDTSGSGSQYSFRTSVSTATDIVGEVTEVEEASPPVEDKVFVAVAEDVKYGKNTLLWALQNLAKDGAKVAIAHVHCPAQMIPIMGAKVHFTRMNQKQVNDYREKERGKAEEKLDEYVLICKRLKVSCEKLIIEKDDVAKGLEDLITLHGITKLVMGAAADKHYSKKMKTPKSKTALKLMETAALSCNIWFTCKGYMICTREANTTIPAIPPSPAPTVASTLSASSIFSNMRSMTIQQSESEASSSNGSPMHDMNRSRTEVTRYPSQGAGGTLSRQCEPFELNVNSRLTRTPVNSMDSWDEFGRRSPSSWYDLSRNHDAVSISGSAKRHPMQESDDGHFSSPSRELVRTICCSVEVSRLTRLTSAERTPLLEVLQADKLKLQQERDAALTAAEDSRRKNEQRISMPAEALNNEFSPFELEQATRDFDEALKIGEGGFGSVYKGSLRNTTVAIKLLHPQAQSMQGQSEFNQEVAVLSRVRHPNLVTLIGACREVFGLVYEFLPNGSLEDRLACINNTPPLTWQVRTKIIYEMCSALTFLHSDKPHPVVHGDLKPANILLDANFVSKLGDFGISRLLIQSNTSTTTLYRTTTPKGTFAYMDPEFLSTGELTPRSDVYSFGIIILRLLTGRPPQRIAEVVEDAMEKGELHSVLDPSAGSWPFVQANQLAHLGLRCSEMSRRRRPDLAGEVWKVVEPLMKSASLTAGRPSFAAWSDDASTPSYFVCPVFQEVMSDPHIAADGFTYEAEAIRGWLDSGHDTSPMTNLKLAHCELIPNRGLRSAILEWQQQQHWQQQEGWR